MANAVSISAGLTSPTLKIQYRSAPAASAFYISKAINAGEVEQSQR